MILLGVRQKDLLRKEHLGTILRQKKDTGHKEYIR